MESKTTGNLILKIRFKTVFRDPFGLKYTFNPIQLDPTLFTDEELYSLKSFRVATHSGSDFPDLIIISVFELDVNPDSYDESKPGPPIPNVVFYRIEDKHKTLAYSLVKYIAWRNGFHVDEPSTKVRESIMSWEFNGVTSNQSPAPNIVFGEHYIAVQDHVPNLSTINFQHFYKLYDAGLQIPIHQELLIEAKYLMDSQRRRSAYLLLYSAIEVATKNFIKIKKPDTDYLIDKMQSPDLRKLYSDYVNKKIEPMVDEAGRKVLYQMGEIRNKIAHQGEDVGMTDLSAHYSFVSLLIKKLEISLGYV